ncbi:hypothetical protein DFH07DRAFT_766092 [Mycena maculata]|uniref:Uncharacterized protein n=1 Tax=Mycena maculata TaxID=230809 RepID=A0AAD7K8D0_9AGAR|nr:hypothetical protein DFH07DRAFT_766092 [Mycena maculata]
MAHAFVNWALNNGDSFNAISRSSLGKDFVATRDRSSKGGSIFSYKTTAPHGAHADPCPVKRAGTLDLRDLDVSHKENLQGNILQVVSNVVQIQGSPIGSAICQDRDKAQELYCNQFMALEAIIATENTELIEYQSENMDDFELHR